MPGFLFSGNFRWTGDLFYCAIRPSLMQRESMELWEHFITGKPEFVTIPGDHMSSLQPPHVAFVAGKIEVSFLT